MYLEIFIKDFSQKKFIFPAAKESWINHRLTTRINCEQSDLDTRSILSISLTFSNLPFLLFVVKSGVSNNSILRMIRDNAMNEKKRE